MVVCGGGGEGKEGIVEARSQAWWHMPFVPVFRRQRQEDLGVSGQLGGHSKLQASQGCIVRT